MSNESLQQEMLSRMSGVYEYARSVSRYDSTLEARMIDMRNTSRIYYRYVIPNWPLQKLIHKIVRILVKPIMMPQVEFNESVSDILQEMRQAQQRQIALQGESLSMVAELEQQVEMLNDQVISLRNALSAANAANAAAPATRPVNGFPAQ